jgi:mannan endo-1,4-beta-mannosidase
MNGPMSRTALGSTTGRDTAVVADTQRMGRHGPTLPQRRRTPARRHRARLAASIAAVIAAAAIVLIFAVPRAAGPEHAAPAALRHGHFALPTAPGSYIGLYPDGVPESYAGVTAFTTATGVKPRVVPYYSGWLEPFQASFAMTAAREGAVPLVQMNPGGISVARIASGRYDGYLSTYAAAVRAYRHPVILSFGHEMNGYWYSWGYQHTPPAVFVAAWRHIVTLFRALGAGNVTWLWTINTIHKRARVPSPGLWWPGSSYVTWVGIDGYYYRSSSTFASLFGPTVAAVRELTHAPILIAETAAAPAAGQPAKIADLFAGIRQYELLGFVWFNAVHIKDWRLSSPAAAAAFRREAETYKSRRS